MMILLSKREYDELVKKAHCVEILAEEKAEAFKGKIKADIFREIQHAGNPHVTLHDFLRRISELLKQY